MLHASPLASAPVLNKLKIGTPLRILRTWQSLEGDNWIQVQIASVEFSGISNVVRRGWVNV